jgi:hypothetical protein
MLTTTRWLEIFDEIVGSAEEFPYDFINYQQNVTDDATEEEAIAFAKIIKEAIEESPYE